MSNNNEGGGGEGGGSSTFTLFDRFRPECPANPQSIHSFDPSLWQQQQEPRAAAKSKTTAAEEEPIWVAVFRTSNNAPSVFVKDEFLNAMRLATGGLSELPVSTTTSNNPHHDDEDKIESLESLVALFQSLENAQLEELECFVLVCPSQYRQYTQY